MNVVHLRTNHRKNPIVDGLPEFSWRLTSQKKDVLQTAYSIEVYLDEDCVFSTGKVFSNQQSFVSIPELKLQSCSQYRWVVTVWDNDNDCASAEAYFETAFLEKSLWKAKWVESPIPRNEAKMFTYGIENPAVLFKRKVVLSDTVVNARLYASAYGCYQVFIDGDLVDQRELAPEFSPYEKILYYQVYDVTNCLSKECHSLEFLVGDGWYFCAQTAVDGASKTAPALLYQLEIEYANGLKEMLCSDGTEQVEKSKIVFSDLFMGTKVDLTLPKEPPQKPIVRDFGYENLKAQPIDAISVVETFQPQQIFTAPNGDTILDFGQVIAGKTVVNLAEPYGTEVSLEHTEVLDEEGNYYEAMIAKQMDVCITDGSSFVFNPSFTFHAFRYVRVKGIQNPKPEDFTAVLLSTPKENKGSFSCADERFSRLYQNIRYSQRNNMMSIPTDCPGREKAGWTGDILIYAETAMLNEEMTPFLSAWMDGVCADQKADGVIPLISPLTKLYDMVAKEKMAPFGDLEMTGIAGWSDAIIWVPYAMYQTTGNKEILSKMYPAMKKWCDYIIRTAKEKRGSNNPEEIDQYLWNTGFHFGEWLVPGRESEGFEICKESAVYIAPFFGYVSVKLMAEIQTILGKDAAAYQKTAQNMKEAIQKGVLDAGALPDYLMGAYALAIQFGLVKEEELDCYAEKLVSLVEKNGKCIGTGFLATPFLLTALDKINRHDLAIDVLTQTKCPSWLYEVLHGATTIWENWVSFEENGRPKRTSFDHYAFGCVDSYIAQKICGIKAMEPGYHMLLIEPDQADVFGDFKRTFVTEAGEVSVERKENQFVVQIPCNTTAAVRLPGLQMEVGSGLYTFQADGEEYRLI